MFSETYNTNNSKICRICLRSCDNPLHIFGEYHVQSDKNLKECLEEICDISVSPDDNLPESICAKCTEVLEQSYSFRILARKNDDFLHKIILEGDYIEESKEFIYENIEHSEDKERDVSPSKSIESVNHEKFADNSEPANIETLEETNEHVSLSDFIEEIDPGETPENIDYILDNESGKEDYLKDDDSLSLNVHEKLHETQLVGGEEGLDFEEHSQPSKEMNFECKYCSKTFTYLRNKNQHEKRHTNEGNRECHVCQRKFYTNYDLKRHLYMHMNERSFGCDACGKMYLTKSELNRHLKIHDTTKKYKCEYCAKDFRELGVLNFHRRTVHFSEKNHQCITCGKFFTTPSKVRRHQKSKVCSQTKSVKTFHDADEFVILEDSECIQENDSIQSQNQNRKEDVWINVLDDDYSVPEPFCT